MNTGSPGGSEVKNVSSTVLDETTGHSSFPLVELFKPVYKYGNFTSAVNTVSLEPTKGRQAGQKCWYLLAPLQFSVRELNYVCLFYLKTKIPALPVKLNIQQRSI